MTWIKTINLLGKLIGKFNFFKLLTIFILVATLETLSVLILSFSINTIFNDTPLDLIFFLISKIEYKLIIVIFISVFSIIIGHFSLKYTSKTVFIIGKKLSELYFKDCFLEGLERFNGIKTDELERKIHYDVLRATDGYILPLLILISKLILLLIIFTIIGFIFPQVLFFSIILVFLLLPLVNLIKKKSQIIGNQLTENYTQRLFQMNKAFDLFREYTIFGLWNKNLQEFNSNNDEIASKRAIIFTYKGMPKYIIEAIIFILVGLSYFIIHDSNVFDIKNLSLLVFLGLKSLPIIQQSFSSLNTINFSSQLMKEVVSETNKILSRPQIDQNYNSNRKLTFSKLTLVNIQYKIDDRILFKNLSINLNKKSKMVITGSSGSGKSTLVDILCGFKNKSDGDIYLNDKKISLFNNTAWQKNISYCGQHTYMLKGTIMENMQMVNPSISVKFVYDIIKSFKFLNPILRNIEILKSRFFDFDKSFSGGELQKFSIIRSIIADRDIFIFDEPTSSLDRISEDAFVNLINNYLNNKCVVIITHSKSLRQKLIINEYQNLQL